MWGRGTDKDSPRWGARRRHRRQCHPAVANGTAEHSVGRVNKVVLVLLAIFLPPLAVYLKTKSTKDTVISLILSFLFWVPGVLFALWKVLV